MFKCLSSHVPIYTSICPSQLISTIRRRAYFTHGVETRGWLAVFVDCSCAVQPSAEQEGKCLTWTWSPLWYDNSIPCYSEKVFRKPRLKPFSFYHTLEAFPFTWQVLVQRAAGGAGVDETRRCGYLNTCRGGARCVRVAGVLCAVLPGWLGTRGEAEGKAVRERKQVWLILTLEFFFCRLLSVWRLNDTWQLRKTWIKSNNGGFSCRLLSLPWRMWWKINTVQLQITNIQAW